MRPTPPANAMCDAAAMQFLDRLSPDERSRLLDAADTIRLARGEALLRRGDPGGDVYLLKEGTLEVLDTRSSPAVVLDSVPAGDLVGEMAFLDQRTRSADVRAAEDCLCHHWPRQRLLDLIETDAPLGRSLYRTLADLVVERSRSMSRLAAAGALGHAQAPQTADAMVRRIAEPLKGVLMTAEALLRRDPQQAEQQVHAALDRVENQLSTATSQRGTADRRSLGLAVAVQLHPYIVRSHLAKLSMNRASGFSEDAGALVHLHRNQPRGAGDLGKIIDRWLLARPTSIGIRKRELTAGQLCRPHTKRGARVVLLNASRSPILADLLPDLARPDVQLTLVETDRAALDTVVDLALGRSDGPDCPPATALLESQVRPLLIPLGSALMSQQRPELGPQDLVYIGGVLDYLPDRIAARLLRTAASMLAPGGQLVITALSDSDDAPIYDYLLSWPTVRRPTRALLDLMARCSLEGQPPDPAILPGLTVIARRKTHQT